MKKSLFCAAAICCAMMLAACSDGTSNVPEFDYEALNAQALEEYLVPVHPGIRGQRPFWNTFSIKYIYAPIFDFDDVDFFLRGTSEYVRSYGFIGGRLS